MKAVALAPAARDELLAAAQWYEERASGLGQAFLDCVGDAMDRIGELPGGFPRWEGDPRFRKVILQRFPYVVFYRERSDAIEVVAIAHGAREPGYWARRT